ncbi:MAG TPA: chromosomal replication initiator protein DnaA [Solirubrobacterales bacterium]|nr:chromosomal replication initiator protein DnaA [Solirubrobacterales bacterium]
MRGELDVTWDAVQRELRASVPESTYRLWFDPLRPASARGSTLFLTGPAHVRRWVHRRYPELLRAALARAGSPLTEVEFVAAEQAGETSSGSSRDAAARVSLNSSYTFDRFVIGPGNRLAHAAALAVAEAPGEAYNPLFLHGPPGLGKTHLLGAIANYLHLRNPELAVHYTTAESFTNEFVACLQSRGIEGFKQRYRRADVLLIDDVQFLQGKARTADEFFHTFNALHADGAQIVLTADRLPGELSALAERLRDRFEWGLTAALEPPDLSTRLIFLANLVRERGMTEVAPEAIRAIASRTVSNLRLLEGALTRVVALSSLTASSLTAEAVDQALPAQRVSDPRRRPEVAEIQSVVAERFGVTPEQIRSRDRAAPVARARQVSMYLTRELTGLSLPAIARAFDRRDHTTVMHAIRRISERSTEDPALARTLEELGDRFRPTEMDRDRTD